MIMNIIIIHNYIVIYIKYIIIKTMLVEYK